VDHVVIGVRTVALTDAQLVLLLNLSSEAMMLTVRGWQRPVSSSVLTNQGQLDQWGGGWSGVH
jgi:hypothetical protein